ncbi:calcium-binding protein [Streptomyces sp. NPDC058751]|uniref:calcium-binding protein n=1 Tax=Streptomyces sp. NPDC058751 TaxID=3346623 RepID=UPI00368A0A93
MRTLRTTASTASLALALGAGVLAASTAQAVTANPASLSRTTWGQFRYDAAAGQINDLRVTAKTVDVGSEDYYVVLITFRDKYDIALSTDQCRYPSAADHKIVECTKTVGVGGTNDTDYFDAHLGDGNDTATLTGPTLNSVYGGKGNDVLKGNSGSKPYGEDGNDRIDGGGGVYGEGSSGGAGNDTLTNCAVACHGGSGNDTLVGTASGQLSGGLFGDDGNDVIHAGAGADLVHGGKGDDKLYGDSGNDKIYGNSGNDLLHGGTGTDTLSGGPGTDRVYQN